MRICRLCRNVGNTRFWRGDGSLSTAHANSASDMLSRLETMTLMGVDHYIGFEIEPTYCEIAGRRIREELERGHGIKESEIREIKK